MTPRVDIGRLVMVPASLLLMITCGSTLDSVLNDPQTPALRAARAVGVVLTAIFYGLVIVMYLRRGPAVATSRQPFAHVAAVTGSWLPLAFPGDRIGVTTWVVVLGDLLTAVGLAWTVVSLRTLGRSFSVLAQARAVVSTGTYRWVRHPLYFGELVACLGLALRSPGPLSVSLWVLLLVLQLQRTRYEEAILSRTLIDYDAYRRTTSRLVPGLI